MIIKEVSSKSMDSFFLYAKVNSKKNTGEVIKILIPHKSASTKGNFSTLETPSARTGFGALRNR
ncbi:MAG: hypothetical protein ACD_24C00027G0001 [uncultured bacterium]|nr:MAG: hypothetical protein ACD_24C00027G0001 [uncultured bacterium]